MKDTALHLTLIEVYESTASNDDLWGSLANIYKALLDHISTPDTVMELDQLLMLLDKVNELVILQQNSRTGKLWTMIMT